MLNFEKCRLNFMHATWMEAKFYLLGIFATVHTDIQMVHIDGTEARIMDEHWVSSGV